MTDYERAQDVRHCEKLLTQAGVRSAVIAGGQSLLAGVNRGDLSFDRLVDITHLQDLRGIRGMDDGVEIGACVTLTRLIEDIGLMRALPIVSRVLMQVGNRTVRNRSTLGGNLAWADANSEVVLLCLALDAKVRTSRRRIPVRALVTGARETSLAPGEIITSVWLPWSPATRRFAFHEYCLRASGGRAIASVMAVADVAGGVARGLRFVVAGLTSSPVAIESLLLPDDASREALDDGVERLISTIPVTATDARWSPTYRMRVAVAAGRAAASEVLRLSH